MRYIMLNSCRVNIYVDIYYRFSQIIQVNERFFLLVINVIKLLFNCAYYMYQAVQYLFHFLLEIIINDKYKWIIKK